MRTVLSSHYPQIFTILEWTVDKKKVQYGTTVWWDKIEGGFKL